MSDTPRTDALYKAWNGQQPYPPATVNGVRSVWDLTQELERELAAMTKRAEEIEQGYIEFAFAGIRPESIQAGIAELRRRVEEAERDAERLALPQVRTR